MTTFRASRILAGTLLLALATSAFPQASDGIQLQLNASEAEAALAILDKEASHQALTDADWQQLFATEPYQRLKKREASMHRDFTDDDFKKFVLSPDLARRAPELQRTLDAWKKADLVAAAGRVLPYLPANATIHAKIYPVIKPKTNSFVFEPSTDAAIFLYLDPDVPADRFENIVAHEMHHIGFASIEKQTDALLANLPPNVKPAAEWIGALGEGFAMLAAAGGPAVDPQATSKPEDRARWNRDLSNYDQDLHTLDQFFLDIIHGKFKTKDEIDEKAFTFFGIQGPWYTVGYKMAVTIEKQYGRATLVECMADPGKLLATYNRAASELNQKSPAPIAVFSPELVSALTPARP